MPVTAYQIGVSFVSDASKVTGAGDAMVRILERIQAAQQRTQMGFNEMAAALRGAARTADTLARTMDRVAKAAAEAASASSKIKIVNVGGGGVGGEGAPAPRQAPVSAATAAVVAAGGSYVSPFSAAASAGGPQGRIAYNGPAGLLGYDPVQREVVRGSSVPMYGAPGPGVLTGGAYGPGTGLVATGSASGGGGASFAGIPGANALVPASGGGTGVGTRGGMQGAGPSGIPLTTGAFTRFGGMNLPRLPTLGPYGKMLGAYAGVETIKGAYEQGMDVDDILAKMAAMQVMGENGQPTAAFTPGQITAAQSQAMATMRRVPGLGYGQGLDVILQTAGLLGSSSKAMELAPQLSFNAQVLSRYGKGDAISQIEKGVQAGELTGLTGKDGQIDVPRLTDFVNRLTRTTVAMGGQLDIGKYLTGIRQFGLGAESSDLDFTTATLPAYMKIMGEARAGTALTSLQQVLLAPVPKTRADRYFTEQKRLGLRDAKGNLIAADQLKDNAQDFFVQTLLPALNKGGYTTPGQITEEIQRLLPRQTTDRLAGAGIMDRALIEKEVNRNLAQQRAGDAPLAAMLQNAPGAQMKALSEGFKALEAVTTDAAMGPTIDIFKRITSSFQGMTDFAKAHSADIKEFARDVDIVLSALLLVAKGAGKILDVLPGPLRKAAEGAMVGGAVGSVLPGAGTAGGAAVGGALGLLNGFSMHPPKGWHSTLGGLSMAPDAATMQKQSYEGPSGGLHMQPIALTISLDGRVLSDTVTHHQTMQAMRPGAAGNSPDPMEVVQRPGVPWVNA